ncbi:MAG: alpha-L-fucosidase [Ardenticatenaceae bacterium]|nr:alpha-L-fucosidase [Ardenticatenaceae bacterium]MCB9445900.1 alpha-L-fucosidase [Ardenticatenaceae bacterium]
MYQPTLSSVQQHPLPDWYHDAKFGIFVHWTISSVPAYAPTGLGDIGNVFAKDTEAYGFTNQPYAEWYQNSLRIKGSPVYKYHHKTYGEDYPYENFAQTFNEASQQWNPDTWTDLFGEAGARYVVLVTKHHDGFLLWDSQHPNPKMPDYRTTRDVTGELTQSVTAKGMKMGLYYSSALDWTFSPQPILGFADLLSSGPASRQYLRYAENHWKELINRYDPAILWSDIAYPPDGNLPELFAYFYNQTPEGVVNDRWFQLPRFYFNPIGKLLLKWLAKRMMNGNTALPTVPHCDYRTTEYENLTERASFKWESVRGIGNSFTYNQFEKPEDYLQAPDLIRMLVDVVSKNGNLLLNVGPRPDGSIPEPQVEALQGIGRWLAVNGEAIYGTRPFPLRPGATTDNGLKVAYTTKENTLYITLLQPPNGEFRLPDLPVSDGSSLTLLGTNQPITWQKEDSGILISPPANLDWEAIPVLRLETKT